jgi:hypothetical protein
MKTNKILLILLFAGLVFTACKKDDKKESPFNAKYSDLTVEENKQGLEDNGIAVVNELDELKSATAIEVAISFSDKSGATVNDGSVGINIAPMKVLAALGQKNSTQAVVSTLKSTMDDPASLTEMWNELVGKYTWNFDAEDWDYTELSDAIVFEFPGKEGDVTNTASITINNFAVKTFTDIDYDIDTLIDPELPTSLKMELKYNSTVLSSYVFSASYTSKGIPTSLDQTLTVDNFSVSSKLSHSPYTKAAETFSFKNGSKIILEMHADASGDWSADNIDNSTVEHKDFQYVDGWTGDSVFDEYTEVQVENIINNGNAYIQLENIKVAGMVDVKSLATIGRDLDEKLSNDEITNQEYSDQMVAALNKYAKFVIVYADNNEKIAVGTFSSEYDEEYQDYNLTMKFVFADGSKVTAEEYFSEGFDGLINEMNQFITNVNDEYGTEIDPIEY